MKRAFLAAGSDTWLSAGAVGFAAIGLGHALQLSNGNLDPDAILWLTTTIALSAFAIAAPRVAVLEQVGDHLAVLILGVGIMTQVAVHLTTAPGMYLQVSGAAYIDHHYRIAVLAVLAGACLSNRPWLGRVAIPAMLITYFSLGLWLLKASPNPYIDVVAWHKEAFNALHQGLNPYAAEMPNIYGRTDWYAPGLADAARVHVGYPYPPLSLLLAAPGHLLAGDYRYTNLAAITLSGALMAYSRPGRLATAAAAAFLLTPRGLFVLEQGWTEATAILMLSATVFVACRFPKLLPYALGLLLAVKQYFILIAPLALLLVPRPIRWREVAVLFGKAAGLAAALTLPMALWNVGAFVHSVVLFQGMQPFRAEALSFLAWTAKGGVPVLPLSFSFFLVLVGWGVGLWRAPRTPAGFATASAFVFLLFFGFAKQAFCNYYFLIVGACCCAAAALAPGETPTASAWGAKPAAAMAGAEGQKPPS